MSFSEWFGNSKVTNDHGKPLVVYHATNFHFEEFKRSVEKGCDRFGPGFYFTRNDDTLYVYGSIIIPVYLRIENPAKSLMREWQINAFFDSLKIENYKSGRSAISDRKQMRSSMLKNQESAFDYLAPSLSHYFDEKDAIQALFAAGIDGVISNGVDPEYVVFDPRQIKSAFQNNGEYDIENPSIFM